MRPRKIVSLAILAAFVFGIIAIALAQTPQMPPETKKVTAPVMKKVTVAPVKDMKMSEKKVVGKNIDETIMGNPELKTLASAIQTAGLSETLKGKGPFTLFAPDNKAFAKIPKEQLDALLADKAKLAAVLNYHLVDARHGEAELLKMKDIKAANGQMLALMPMGKNLMVGEANVVKANIHCSNGVIHIIDTVLMPKADEKPVETTK